MRAFLKRIPEGFVIISNEETLSQEGDKYLGHPDYNKVFTWSMSGMHEGKAVWIYKVLAQEPNIIFSDLTEDEQTRIGWVDVEGIAELKRRQKYIDGSISTQTKNHWQSCYKEGFTEGFQKAREFLSDKVFTLDDIHQAIKYGSGAIGFRFKKNSDFIESLTQKSWQVEIEITDNKVKILRIL